MHRVVALGQLIRIYSSSLRLAMKWISFTGGGWLTSIARYSLRADATASLDCETCAQLKLTSSCSEPPTTSFSYAHNIRLGKGWPFIDEELGVSDSLDSTIVMDRMKAPNSQQGLLCPRIDNMAKP